MQKLNLHILLITFLFASACSKFNKLQKSDNIQARYQGGVMYYEKKDYQRAGILFEELIPLMKGSAEAEKVNLSYSYCQFYMKQYVLAAYYFKRFAETFPRSAQVEEALYMHVKALYADVPEYSLDQTNTYDALNSIQDFFRKYPRSQYADELNQIVDVLRGKLEKKAYEQAKLFYKVGDYKAAVVALENFKKEFPGSVHNEEFTFLKLKAQFQLSEISIETKRVERYTQAIDFYHVFVDQYPSSKYLKEAEELYSESQNYIQKHKSKS